MLAAVREVLRRRPVSGLAVSLVLHVLAATLMLGVATPAGRYMVKRGEPLFIELPELPETPPGGLPGAPSAAAVNQPQSKAPAKGPVPPPARESVKSAVAMKPTPPAPAVAASRGGPPEPPRSQPEPTPEAADAHTPRPAPPAETAPSPPAPQVASIPPKPEDAVDIRSALRRGAGGGAGGHGEGRGGIEGEPIPLDSADPRYSDYLEHIRKKIKSNWGYPCIKNAATGECEYQTAQLVVEFGIAKDGDVRFVNVVRPSGWDIYDDWAVNAIKLSSPFLPVPDALGKGKGIPILATFSYVVSTSFTNLLH